ncbi:MAG: DUF4231 domain-containing protein [bacterium]
MNNDHSVVEAKTADKAVKKTPAAANAIGSPTNGKILEVKIDFIKKEIESAIRKFNKKQRRNSKFGYIVKMLALTFSAIVTILLGLNLEPATIFKNIALVISACTGVVAGISAFFDFNELSIKYKDTVDKLELLKVKLNYIELDRDHVDFATIDKIKDNYLRVLQQTHEYFQSVRKDQGAQTKTSTDQ